MTLPTDELLLEVEDSAAEITFNRPEKRNAITAAMWSQLISALDTVAADPEVSVLILKGAGGAFCSGADLGAVRDDSGKESADFRALAERGIRAVLDFPKPSIAAVEGACVGAGSLLAVCCDVRFVAPGAKFAVPAVRYGFEVESRSLDRLVRLMGPGQANRFLLSGVTLSGDDAVSSRLAEVCVEDPLAAAREFAREVAAGQPHTLRSTKAAISRTATT